MTVTDNYGTAQWQALDAEHHLHPFTDTKNLIIIALFSH